MAMTTIDDKQIQQQQQINTSDYSYPTPVINTSNDNNNGWFDKYKSTVDNSNASSEFARRHNDAMDANKEQQHDGKGVSAAEPTTKTGAVGAKAGEPEKKAQGTAETKAEGTADNGEPQLSNFHFFQDLYKRTMPDVMSKEEDEKKAKKLRTEMMISQLGNMLTAFSNLIYTTKGAPSQKIPEIPGAKVVQTFRDRVQKAREAALKGRAEAAEKDYKLYGDAYNIWAAKQKAEAQKPLKEAEETLAKLKIEKAAAEADKARAEAENTPERLKLGNEYTKARIGAQNATAYRNRQVGKGANKVAESAIDEHGNYYTRSTKFSESEAKQIVQDTGLNGMDLSAFEEGAEYDMRGNKIKEGKVDWAAAAAWAIRNGMLSAKDLIGMGFEPSENAEGKSGNATKKKNPMGSGKNPNPMN